MSFLSSSLESQLVTHCLPLSAAASSAWGPTLHECKLSYGVWSAHADRPSSRCYGDGDLGKGAWRTPKRHSGHLPSLWQGARVQEECPYLMSPGHGYPQDVISLDPWTFKKNKLHVLYIYIWLVWHFSEMEIQWLILIFKSDGFGKRSLVTDRSTEHPLTCRTLTRTQSCNGF